MFCHPPLSFFFHPLLHLSPCPKIVAITTPPSPVPLPPLPRLYLLSSSTSCLEPPPLSDIPTTLSPPSPSPRRALPCLSFCCGGGGCLLFVLSAHLQRTPTHPLPSSLTARLAVCGGSFSFLFARLCVWCPCLLEVRRTVDQRVPRTFVCSRILCRIAPSTLSGLVASSLSLCRPSGALRTSLLPELLPSFFFFFVLQLSHVPCIGPSSVPHSLFHLWNGQERQEKRRRPPLQQLWHRTSTYTHTRARRPIHKNTQTHPQAPLWVCLPPPHTHTHTDTPILLFTRPPPLTYTHIEEEAAGTSVSLFFFFFY